MRKILIVVLFFIISQFCFSWEGFTPGKYYMLASNVNIRSAPHLEKPIIGRLNLHDEIKILEPPDHQNSDNWQWIHDMYFPWVKIQYKNIIGYVFGAYIAAKRVICDVDNNGIVDYFYIRYTYFEVEKKYQVVTHSGIIIYYNNKEIVPSNIINTTTINDVYKWFVRNVGYKILDDGIHIILYHDRPDVIADYWFTPSGDIKYLGLKTIDRDYLLDVFGNIL